MSNTVKKRKKKVHIELLQRQEWKNLKNILPTSLLKVNELTKIVKINPIKRSIMTRTAPYLYNGIFKYKDNEIKTFIKMSEISSINNSQVKEIELYKITNKLILNKILNSIVYCFNDLFLNSSIEKHNNKVYTSLVLEDVTEYKSLEMYLKTHKKLPNCVIFELVYTLHIFDRIQMKHMDLHGENIYVKRLPEKERKVIKYSVILDNKVEIFYVPTDYSVKIIDFDGGQKNSMKQNNPIKNEFKGKVNNPKVYPYRKVKESRVNILRLIHTIQSIRPSRNITNQLYQMRMGTNRNVVPFYPNQNTLDVNHSKIYKNYLKKFGYVVSKNNKSNMIELNNRIVRRPETILKNMLKGKIYKQPFKEAETYSELSLYS